MTPTWRGVAIVLMLFGFVVPSAAQESCLKYYGRGYCTDYVQQRLGIKQRGDAQDWTCNVAMIHVRKGDVAVFSFHHVAVVEEVILDKKDVPRHVRITEWNWGTVDRRDPEKNACIIADKFGVKTERIVKTASATCYWRP